jgi:hypothetical protein
MTWSKLQRTTFLSAARKAGWNAEQRYAVMRYAGCASDVVNGRPSVTAVSNTNRHFRECMAIAEGSVLGQGGRLRPPKDFPSWDAACNDTRAAEAALARAIAREAQERLSVHFDGNLLNAAVAHVATVTSNPLLPGVKPDRLEQCDGPTTHRVTECLRAWVGRKFLEGGLTPRTFQPPREARQRAERMSA